MTNIRDRKFGCELELSTPFHEVKKIFVPIIKNVYKERCVKCSESADSTYSNYNYWHLKTEPTSESEICTPISTHKDLPKIKKVIKNLSKQNVLITKEDSLHVHVEASDVPLANILALWIEHESAIKKCFPKRRWKGTYSPEIVEFKGTNKNVASFLEKAIEDSKKHYCCLSFNHYDNRKTVEFRISEGTVNPNHIRNWTKFCLIFINYAKKLDPIKCLCNYVNTSCIDELIVEFRIRDQELINWLKMREKSKLI